MSLTCFDCALGITCISEMNADIAAAGLPSLSSSSAFLKLFQDLEMSLYLTACSCCCSQLIFLQFSPLAGMCFRVKCKRLPRPGTGVILPNRKQGWDELELDGVTRESTQLWFQCCLTKWGWGWGWERGKRWPFWHRSLSAVDVSQNLLIELRNGWNISYMSSTQTCSNSLLFLYDMLYGE